MNKFALALAALMIGASSFALTPAFADNHVDHAEQPAEPAKDAHEDEHNATTHETDNANHHAVDEAMKKPCENDKEPANDAAENHEDTHEENAHEAAKHE